MSLESAYRKMFANLSDLYKTVGVPDKFKKRLIRIDTMIAMKQPKALDEIESLDRAVDIYRKQAEKKLKEWQ